MTDNTDSPLALQEKFLNGYIDKATYIEKMHEFHKILFSYSNLLKNTDIESIEIEVGAVVMKMKESGLKFICSSKDYRVTPIEILNFNDFEKPEMEMAFSLLTNPQTILDVGANFGWYSCHLSKKYPKSRIHAFEPIPDTRHYLERNIDLNSSSNVHVVSHGLSDRDQDIEFFFYPEGSGNASMRDLSQRDSVTLIKAHVRRLDDFVHENGLNIDFIKCDVEGAEFLVFKGAVNTLREQRPIVLSELLRKWSKAFDYHPNDVIEFFSDLNYGCYTITKGELTKFWFMDEKTVETNFFFLPNEMSENYLVC